MQQHSPQTLQQQFQNHDKNKDNLLTIKQTINAFQVLLGKKYYHGIISSKMRNMKPDIEEPILVDIQSFKKIYEALNTLDSFQKQIRMIYDQVAYERDEIKNKFSQLDFQQKQRGANSKINITMGPQRQQYANKISVKVKKYLSDEKKEPTPINITLQLKTKELQKVKKIAEQFLTNVKQFLVMVLVNLIEMPKQQIQRLLQCLITTATINNAASTVDIYIEFSNEQMRDVQMLLFTFFQQIFQGPVQFYFSTQICFQKSLVKLLLGEDQDCQLLDFLFQDSHIGLEVEVNQILSVFKELLNSVLFFDDLQFNKYHFQSNFMLFILSHQSGFLELEFDNFKASQFKYKQLFQPINAMKQLIIANFQSFIGILSSPDFQNLRILNLFELLHGEIGIMIQVACFKININIKIQDLERVFKEGSKGMGMKMRDESDSDSD